MDSCFPFDIASRASNLSERRQIFDMLRERGSSLGACTELSIFDLWKIEKIADKLTGQSLKEALRKGELPKNFKEELVALLTAHRLWELNLASLGEERQLLAEIHVSWLPTYQSSLEDFNAPDGKVTEAGWRQSDTYYGRFAKACEPFLVQLERELNVACTEASQISGVNVFCPQIIEDIQNHFIDRFELALAWAIETDINVYCARNRINKAHGTSENYVSYFEQIFADKDSYHSFYLRFPVLGRWLARVTRLLCGNGRALIERLRDDASELSDAFFGKRIVQFKSLKLGKSDYHAGGQTVAFVEVELAGSGHEWFVYKPRCLRSEIAMQGLLERLAKDGVLGFATRHIISKDAYGYEELIPAERNHVRSRGEAERIYEELGGYLAIFYALGGGDLHFENIIVADGHAFICDCETVLGVQPVGQNQSAQSVLDSVYKTGLLEWPRTPTAEAVPAMTMKISGYAGGESYELPIPVPRVNDHRMSFELSVKHEIGVQVEPDAANRVYLADSLVRPEDFKDSIIKGFNVVYEWFQKRPAEAIRCVCELFEDAPVRFVNWSTQLYVQLMVVARHPTCLMDPLEVDLVVNRLREHLRKWDKNGVLVEREVSSLWQLDVPIFTTSAHGLELLHDHQTLLPVSFEATPIQYASERIIRLSPQDCLKQVQYIAASLSVSEVHSPSFIASAVDYACQIGWQLCELMRNEGAPWGSFQITPEGISDVDIGTDLYDGTAGIALFLAYLDAIVPQKEFRLAAERAMSHAITNYGREQIGVFRGVGGLVYLLTHLHRLWKDPKLLERAVELSHSLSAQIETDKNFDVLSGVAGIIPVMIGLAEATSGEGLDYAHRCARYLLQHAEGSGNGLSWPFPRPEEAVANLTGFSHGASGIGWALISLGCVTDRQDYIAAGRRAFAYEALYFDESEEDWYDLRTNVIAMSPGRRHFANAWCNGAAGIGLSRIASWAILGKADEELLKEAYLALAATLRNFRRLGNDTLCHGKAGNAELFLRFSQLKDEPAFQLEANMQAQVQWRDFETTSNWHFGAGDNQVFAGLMLGLAGVGMHFLRLAHPERVASPLLLDPPLTHL